MPANSPAIPPGFAGGMALGSWPPAEALPAAPRPIPADASQLAHRLTVALLLFATVLQKVAVPGTGGSETAMPISLLLMPILMLTGIGSGVMLVDGRRLAAYLVFMACSAVSFLLSESLRLSMTGWIFVAVMQACFVFRFAPGRFDFARTLRLLSNMAVGFSLIGVGQFCAQFVVGREIAFFMEHYLPPGMLMSGYNFMIPLVWDSPILKSNGVVFAEPSFFCQFLALGMIGELLRAARPWRLAVIGLGLVASYSGTGLMTLAIFLPWYIIDRRRYDLMLLGLIGLALLATQADFLQLSAITDRTAEFSNPNSSAFGRFFSIFMVLQDYILTDLPTLLFGRGPGSVMEFFSQLHYGAFDPTWGKIFYEYGLLGFIAYFTFFTVSFMMARREMRVPLAFTYLFLGGYLVNISILSLLLALVSLPALQRAAPGPGPGLGSGLGAGLGSGLRTRA
ncbi:hypothetical protein BKE38_01145 [Pseudoroseomonas deserti]|uniref:O-antigen polymerase n=2 Tax=Teichococcus deserti TaxID=1817963 RepID=A0A1V2H8E2_9PROT|nr:hypothetical protein BKE38_01145 [Pseudoroseomonas deserti]